MTHSLTFRIKVLSVKEKEKLSFKKVAERFGVGVASVMRWSKNPKPLKNRNKPATKIDMEALKKDIETNPDSYQYERAQRFGVTQTGMWHAFKRLKVTYKKKLSTIRRRTQKSDLPSLRSLVNLKLLVVL